jgi:glycine cleavage system H lipoate-binding protein
MFPGVDGFEWTAGHLIFLGIFFAVLGVIAATVALACVRARRDAQAQRIEHIRWAGEFHDLPEAERACRHQISGKVKQRVCKLKFDCRVCETHPKLAGPEVPERRMYHRGHAWAEFADDGTVTIGLDQLGRSLIGTPDAIELPAVGSNLEVSGPAWRMKKNGTTVRILSPVEGEVLETSNGEESSQWYVKVRPSDQRTTHLLRGQEVKTWNRRELDKLQALWATTQLGVTMADGGELAENLSESCPREQWEKALAAIFLEG